MNYELDFVETPVAVWFLGSDSLSNAPILRDISFLRIIEELAERRSLSLSERLCLQLSHFNIRWRICIRSLRHFILPPRAFFQPPSSALGKAGLGRRVIWWFQYIGFNLLPRLIVRLRRNTMSAEEILSGIKKK